MRHHLRQFWQSFRPVLTGWMMVLLLVPSLMASVPAQAEASQWCIQSSDASGQKQDMGHDCSCCLPAGQHQLAAADAPSLPEPVVHALRGIRPVALLSVRYEAPFDLAKARGPPSSLSI